MSILDDLEKISKIDSQDMLGVVEKFAVQLEEAKRISESARIDSLQSRTFEGIVIMGMGGSGFTGDIINSLLSDEVSIPVTIIKGYNLPFFINEKWLVIAISYSGNTEETISVILEAINRNCSVICISSGGNIKKIAEKNKKVLVKVPGGYQPRGASGYLIFTTYLVMGRIGIVKIKKDEIDRTIDFLKDKAKRYGRNTKTEDNYAKKLAFELVDFYPVVYGMEGYLSAVAYRWKCEINENSKCPCYWNVFPELNHNETVGWQNLKDITERFALLVFNDSEASDRIKVRIKTTIDLVGKNFAKVLEIPVQGDSKLKKALSTIFLGDITSVYLSFLYGVDPTPIERISVLKSELSKLDS